MEITLLAVGRLRRFYRDAFDEYAGRLSRYVRFREVELREARQGTEALGRQDEARRLTARLPASAAVVALSRTGEAWSSEELARRLDGWRLAARPLALVIGGSTGLDRSFLERADLCWSLGPLTLPHELARVVVAEQLYRGFTILRGEPYHKGARR